jgi:hypothetical protein
MRCAVGAAAAMIPASARTVIRGAPARLQLSRGGARIDGGGLRSVFDYGGGSAARQKIFEKSSCMKASASRKIAMRVQ